MKIYIGLAVFFVSTSCTTVERSVDRFPSSVSIDITKLQNKLKPFSSNGCSKFSSGIAYPKVEKWGLCCVQHDISYWKGGTNDDRYQADQRLQNCIIEVGEPNIARLVYWGVRAGNNDNANMSSTWGFGWVLNRGYSPFSAEEKTQVDVLEKQIPTDLTKVNISKDDGTKDKETLTGDYCLDSSVMFIQRNLSRKMTPLTASEQNSEVAGGFEYSVSIMTKECHKPYVFIYSLSKKDSCTRRSTEQNYRQEVSLKDIVYPEECL